MTTKHKILSITVLETGRKKPTEHIACLWKGKSQFDVKFYDEAYFHFTQRDLVQGKKDPEYFDGFTLINFRVIGEWN